MQLSTDLALLGGEPAVPEGVHVPWPVHTAEDRQAVAAALGRQPNPLQVQRPETMDHWLRALEKVYEHRKEVFTAHYEPLELVPPIPAADL